MRRIAIATCSEFPDLIEDDRPVLEGLRTAGVAAEAVRWDGEVEWRRYDLVLLRSVWDYFRRRVEFAAWLDRLDALGVPCRNPTSLVRWNMDKRYLRDLEARGVPTLPTLWIGRDDGVTAAGVAARVAEAGWDDVVLKPTVSGGAWRTLRLRRREIAAQEVYLREVLRDSDLMVQPFATEVVAEGEYALVFFEGEFSHAVLKRPSAGDYRVQWVHGGTQEAVRPGEALLAAARQVLSAAPEPGLYARVDGIVRDGRFLLMELEQIEPFLFLALAPGSAVDLARRLLDPARAPHRSGAG